MTPDPAAPAPEDLGGRYERNTAVMTMGTSLSRFTGFLRLSAQLWALGVTGSALADTYVTANTTPNILYELALGGILTSVFVPLFVDWNQRHGQREAWEIGDRVLTLTVVVLSAVALLGAIFAPQIMALYNSISDSPDRAAQLELGTFFLRWFMPQIVFYGVGAVAGGLLNAGGRFAAPMFAPILNNVVVIAMFGAYVWILHGGAPASVAEVTDSQRLLLAAGTTLGVFAMTAALWPSLRSIGYRWRPRFDFGHAAIRRLGRLAGWVAVYVVANQIAYFIIIVLAGRVQGGITAYAAAFIVYSLPHAIFAVSIFTALLPGMSAAWSDGRVDDVRVSFSRGMRDTIAIITPAAVGLAVLAGPIVVLLFQHGQTGSEGAALIADTLRAFAVGLPFFSAFQMLTRTFYAMHDTRTPALTNIAVGIVNLGADIVFMFGFDMGIPGLALGHALSYVVGTAILSLAAGRRLDGLDGRSIRATAVRTIAASTAMGAAVYAVARLLDGLESSLGGPLLQVTSAVIVGVLVFVGAARIVRLNEVADVVRALSRRFRR